jgi:hypothetical protein
VPQPGLAESPENLLGDVHRYVLENAQRELGWYSASVGSKRRWSMALRGGSLVLVALSGLLPLINTLGTEAHWPAGPFFPAPMTLITNTSTDGRRRCADFTTLSLSENRLVVQPVSPCQGNAARTRL